MNVADIKAAARTAAFARRKTAHDHVDAVPAQAVLSGLLAAEPAGTVVALYDPIRTEIDPRPAVARSVGRLRLVLPVIAGAGQPLRFREWTLGAPLETGPFGVAIPTAGAWCDPEILIVPLLAYDARGYRLGYGGGFYDRTLEGLRTRGSRVLAIGFAYAAQQIECLPTEPTDQPLGAIVTETGLQRFIGAAR